MIPNMDISGIDQSLLIIVILCLGMFFVFSCIVILFIWINRNPNIKFKLDIMGHNKGGLFKQFPHRCKIWVQRSGGKVEYVDRFGQFKVNGAYVLLFKKSKIIRAPLKDEYISQDGDTWFFSDSAVAAYPANWSIKEDVYDITPIKDYDAITFMIEQGKNDIRAFSQKDKILEYMPYIAIILIFLFAAAAFLLGVNMMTGSMNEQSKNTAEAALAMKNSMELITAACNLNTTKVITPPV